MDGVISSDWAWLSYLLNTLGLNVCALQKSFRANFNHSTALGKISRYQCEIVAQSKVNTDFYQLDLVHRLVVDNTAVPIMDKWPTH